MYDNSVMEVEKGSVLRLVSQDLWEREINLFRSQEKCQSTLNDFLN